MLFLNSTRLFGGLFDNGSGGRGNQGVGWLFGVLHIRHSGFILWRRILGKLFEMQAFVGDKVHAHGETYASIKT